MTLTIEEFKSMMDSPPASREVNREAWLAVSQISKCDIIAVDTETTGLEIRDGRGYLVGISVAWREDTEIKGYYFPLKHLNGDNLDRAVFEYLKETLENSKCIIYHNAKFDIQSLLTVGIDVTKVQFYCTMLMCHAINENRPFAKTLNWCADHYLEGGLKRAYREADLERKRARRNGNEIMEKAAELRMELIQAKMGTYHKEISEDFKKWIEVFGWHTIPVRMMRPYATQDAILTYQLFEAIHLTFSSELPPDYWIHRQKFTNVIRIMENTGVRINVAICEREIAKGEARMAQIVKSLGGLNPGSTTDLHYLLIDKLKLPVLKTTPGGKPSFDKTVMPEYDEMLEAMNEEAATLVLEYRGWQKTVSSNYRAYLELLSPDGRLRCNYKLHGTKTGRLSCEKPNLQQIPKSSDKEWNGHLKDAFIPEDGFSLWGADYAQLELRLSAQYSGEEALITTFNEDRDIFDEMSGGVGLDRDHTKKFVYVTQYGGGIRQVKVSLNITESKAREIRANYLNSYPKLKLLTERCASTVRQSGRIKLWTGRYRHFFNPEKEAHKAMNSLMQGGGADIVERQMVRVYEKVAAPSNGECRMLLQIHDEIVFEIKTGKEEEYLPRIKEVMEDVNALVPDNDKFKVKFAVKLSPWGTK
jgi:DNA polymerase I-like protein with 3'-5' exonuclease and polymerase domains